MTAFFVMYGLGAVDVWERETLNKIKKKHDMSIPRAVTICGFLG
jgi:hypothetical protein